MQFILTGFTPETRFRVFAFQGIAADRTRTNFTVRADLNLIRTHGILIQDLPVICKRLLEWQSEGDRDLASTLTITEDQMRVHADICTSERAAGKTLKPNSKSPNSSPSSTPLPVS